MIFFEFLKVLNMNEDLYIRVIRFFLNILKVFLKRNVLEIRVNVYNNFIFRCWEVNIDVQFIFDVYVCVVYVVFYILKL